MPRRAQTLNEYRLRIMLVDDDANYATLVQRALRQAAASEGDDIDIDHLSDGDVALDYLLGRGEYADRARHPVPDIVLLDERMPRMDGSDVLAALRRERLTPDDENPLICHMTSGASAKLLRRCYHLGATFCIEKPMAYEQLQEKLKLMMAFFKHVLELPRLAERVRR